MPFNLIIVDDEAEIRVGLRHKMNWKEMGFQIVGEAANGKEALKLLEQDHVHLMITDIRMPVMDGLELLQEQSLLYPQVKTIILSGYDDFAYAKTAIQSGAKDYLLKPVFRKELAELVQRLREELEQEHLERCRQDRMRWQLDHNLILMREQFMLELIHEQHADHAEMKKKIKDLQLDALLNEAGGLRVVCIEMKLRPGRIEDEQGQLELMRYAFRLLCRETVQPYSPLVFAFHTWNHPNMMHLVVRHEEMQGGHPLLDRCIKQLQANIENYLKIECIIAVGNAVYGMQELKAAYTSSLLVWSQNSLGSQSEILWPEDGCDKEIPFTQQVEKRLVLLIESYDKQGVNDLFGHLLTAEAYTLKAISQFVIKAYLLMDGISKRNGVAQPQLQSFFAFVSETIHDFHSIDQICGHLNETAFGLIEELEQARSTGGEQAVRSIQQYIDQNYASDIGLSTLAEQFFINPNYLSELFKKYVGLTFSEYVIRIRITKAEELLHDPLWRLSDIAELVGFSNASYLSSVFKKYYGKSPNEYRLSLS